MVMDKMTVALRPFTYADAEQYRSWINDTETGRLLGRSCTIISQQEHEAWYARVSADPAVSVRAIEASGEYVGNVWLWNIDRGNRKSEVRIAIGRPYQNRGIGRTALAAITELAFNQLDLHRVYAYVFAYNPRALRVFQKAGFLLEGTLRHDRFINGLYHDAHVMSLCRGDS